MIRLVEYTSNEGEIIKDGERWNSAVVGSTTCDGAVMYNHYMKKAVKDRVDEIVAERPGSVVSKWHEVEQYHKADMAYGKDRDVVTWEVVLAVRFPVHGKEEG